MTEEQIKQNADAYADKLYEARRYIESTSPTIQEIYIEGAHSRDEEVKRLYNSLEHFRSIINNLCHPWINAKDRLPEEDPNNKGYSCEVIGFFPSGCVSKCFCSIEEDIWFIDDLPCDKPTYWMSMPELITTK